MSGRDAAFEAWADAARAVKIEDEIARRGHLGALRRSGGELVGPCPRCGGRDRFSVHPGKNLWHCRGCSTGGDAIALVECLDDASFVLACEILTGEPPPGHAGTETPAERAVREQRLTEAAAIRAEDAAREARNQEQFRERERRRCRQFYERAAPIGGTMAEAYLALRGLTAPPGAKLRYAADHPLWDKPPPAGTIVHRGPALLGAIAGPDGRFAGLHATWIDLDDADGKARVPDPKTGEFVAAKKTRGSASGGTILLAPCREPKVLFIGEGIESVLSVREALVATQAEVLAIAEFRSALSLGNLSGRAAGRVPHPTLTTTDKLGRVRRETVPSAEPLADDTSPMIAIAATIEDIVLIGDGDSEPFRTRLAMERAAARFSAAYPWVTVRLAMAPNDYDFNDVWRGLAA